MPATYLAEGRMRDEIDAEGEAFLKHLLELGKGERFDEIREYAGGLEDPLRVYASRGTPREFAFGPACDDLDALIKAIAVFEDTIRMTGSPSMNAFLLAYRPGGDNSTLDWVLRKTNYWYYGRNARSLAEYEAGLARSAILQMTGRADERARHSKAVQKRAIEATASLHNAVRRGDAAALSALLAKGGDSRVVEQKGESLLQRVLSTGKTQLICLVEADLKVEALIAQLLELGNSGRFDDASKLGEEFRPETETLLSSKEIVWRKVARYSDAEQGPLVKALAKFDEGLGCFDTSDCLTAGKVLYVPDGDNSVMDWVLQHTQGWCQSRGAKTLQEYERQLQQNAAAIILLEREQARANAARRGGRDRIDD